MKKLRVLLINPPQMLRVEKTPTASPPLGLAYIAAALEQHYDVFVMDCMAEGFTRKKYLSKTLNMWGMDTEEVGLRLPNWDPDVVGISALYSSQDEVVPQIARLAKEYGRIQGKAVYTVVGGPHATAGPKQILKNKDIDFVVLGEGEDTMLRLCEIIRIQGDPSTIHGLAYRNQKGRVKVTPRSGQFLDVDDLPMPARHLLPTPKYFLIDSYFQPMNKPFANMILSRGCDNNCLFCSVPEHQGDCCRYRSPRKIIHEMKFLAQKYGIKEIYFEDDNLLRDLDFAQELCERIIGEELDLIWSCPAGIVARGYNHRLLQLMKNSGCYSITINAESGSDRVLGEIINSPNDRDIMINLVDRLKSLKIQVRANFRVGWPEETREEIKGTYKFLQSLDLADFRIYTAVPFPGTPFWDKCIDEQLFAKPFKFKEYLTNEFFINSTNFTTDGLPVLMEECEKNLWVKSAMASPDVLMDSVGGFFDKLIHPFTNKEKKKGR